MPSKVFIFESTSNLFRPHEFMVEAPGTAPGSAQPIA